MSRRRRCVRTHGPKLPLAGLFLSLPSHFCAHTRRSSRNRRRCVWGGGEEKRGQSGGRERARGDVACPSCPSLSNGSPSRSQPVSAQPLGCQTEGWSRDQSGGHPPPDFPTPVQSPAFGNDWEIEMSLSPGHLYIRGKRGKALLILPSPFNPISARIWTLTPQ